MNKRQLTDRFLRSLPPAKHGTRNDIWDSVVPTFGVCVYDSKDSDPARRGKAGKIAFIMYTRFKRGAAPARRIIGIYPTTTLEETRRTAGEWRSLIARGIDPAAVEKAIQGERTASELQDRVTELVEQQTAISEVLRAIANSPHDLQPIFDAIWTAPHVSVEQT